MDYLKQPVSDNSGVAVTFEPFWNETSIKTYLFDACSVLLPAGEQFVIAVVESSALQLQQTSALAERSRHFVVEERAHQRAHRLYNQRLEAQGFEVKKFEHMIEKDLEALLDRKSTRLNSSHSQ